MTVAGRMASSVGMFEDRQRSTEGIDLVVSIIHCTISAYILIHPPFQGVDPRPSEAQSEPASNQLKIRARSMRNQRNTSPFHRYKDLIVLMPIILHFIFTSPFR
jgi:hypothetical protein